jgi:uncharacterized membrane protein
MLKNMESLERRRIRDRIVSKGRTKVRQQIVNGSYADEVRYSSKTVNTEESISNKSSLKEMIRAIEEDRMRRMVYDKEYQRIDLEDWHKMRARQDRSIQIQEESKNKQGTHKFTVKLWTQ